MKKLDLDTESVKLGIIVSIATAIAGIVVIFRTVVPGSEAINSAVFIGVLLFLTGVMSFSHILHTHPPNDERDKED